MLSFYMLLFAIVNLISNLIYKIAASNNHGFLILVKSKFVIIFLCSVLIGGTIDFNVFNICHAIMVFVAEYCFYRGITSVNTYGLTWYFCILPFISAFFFNRTTVNFLIVALTILLAPQWSPWILLACISYSLCEFFITHNPSKPNDMLCTQSFLLGLLIPSSVSINFFTTNIAINNIVLRALLTIVLTQYNYCQILTYRVLEVIGNYLINQFILIKYFLI